MLAGLVVVPLGLASRFLLGGWIGDGTGGMLYAVLVYLLVAFCAPGLHPATVAAAGWILCCGVELLQLTSIPQDLAAVFPPMRLLLGTTFVAWDLLAYAGGAALALLVDRWITWRPRAAIGASAAEQR